ncbi:MAG: hypothetical protein ACE5E9_07745 [Nitrospinaceae bacterium]
MNKGSLLTIGFLIFIGYLSFSLIWTGNKYECDVCILYKGTTVCQKVKGMDKQDTIMTGVSTACAGAADGRTEIIDCQARPPTKKECKKL